MGKGEEDRMNKIDTTKYLRQMKYLPDITPLSNILLIVILILFPGTLVISFFWPIHANPPGMKYAHYQPSDNSLPTVVISKSGIIYFGNSRSSENIFELRNYLVDQMEEMQVVHPKKIMIYADAEAPWWKIIDMLQVAKEAGIEVVGFMMEGGYSVLYYWDMKNLYREKGLKEPSVIQ